MTKPVRITDHALVRFMERAGGLDLNGLRAQLQDSLKRAATIAGHVDSNEYTVAADGLLYVVEKGVLITIRDHHPQQTLRKARRR